MTTHLMFRKPEYICLKNHSHVFVRTANILYIEFYINTMLSLNGNIALYDFEVVQVLLSGKGTEESLL